MTNAHTIRASMPPPATNPHHPLMRWGEKHGLQSVAAIAKRLGVARNRLSQIVTRKHRPTTDLALQIMQVTGISFEALSGLTTEEVAKGIVAGWEKPKRRKRQK